MDSLIPAPARRLLEFISSIEAPRGYGTIYGNNQDKLPKPLTEMTLAEVVKAQPGWAKRFGSSACGAYQFMRDTLDKPGTIADLKGELGLSGDELFDADMQDRLGFHLLKRRGYAGFMAGTVTLMNFAKRLAQEWASFPVLAPTAGATRKLRRGQSYYAGDGVNKALVSAETIEQVLAEVKAMGDAPEPAPAPAPRPMRPETIEELETAEVEAITDRDTVARAQEMLFNLGYTEVGSKRPDGTFDGKIGRMTETAVLAFRNENDLPLKKTIDDELLSAIAKAKPREISTERTEATPVDVRNQVPEVKANWWSQVWAFIIGIPAVIGAGADGIIGNIPGARDMLRPIKEIVQDVPVWVWFVAVGGVAFAIWQNSRKGEKKGIEAFQSGERR